MPKCEIDLHASPTFERLLSSSKSKFPNLMDDFQGAFSRIEQDFRRAAQASAIPGFNQTIWKYRCKCSDLRQGASGGIRIIAYYYAERNVLYPLTFYFRRDKEDIAAAEIRAAIEELKNILGESR